MNQTEQIKVHAINPSWLPSISLKKEVNKTSVNIKTKENWIFTDAHLNYLAHFEKACKVELKHYDGTNYTLHLATAYELLSFDDMISYLNDNKVPNKLYYYDTNHRFETINELLEIIKHELIP